MHVFYSLFLACLTVSVGSAAADDFNKLRLESTFFVRNQDGQTIPLPQNWQDEEVLKRIIVFEGRHPTLNTRQFEVQRKHKEVNVHTADYFDVSTVLYENVYSPAALYVKVLHDGYFLEQHIYDFSRHDGPKSVGTLYIERRYFNDGERREEVLAFLDRENYNQSDVDEVLTVLMSLLVDQVKPEDYSLLVQLVSKLLQEEGRLPTNLVGELQLLSAARTIGASGRTRFSELGAEAQFETLSGLGYWFARSPVAKQQVLPNLTYYQLAQQFFEFAVEMAFTYTQDLDRFAMANVFQNYYKLECELGLPEDCFAVIGDFVALLDEFETRGIAFPDSRKKAFLADYRVKVEELSEYGKGRDVTDDAFIARMASDTEMRAYWNGFFNIAQAEPMKPVVAASPGLTRTKLLASRIIDQQTAAPN